MSEFADSTLEPDGSVFVPDAGGQPGLADDSGVEPAADAAPVPVDAGAEPAFTCEDKGPPAGTELQACARFKPSNSCVTGGFAVVNAGTDGAFSHAEAYGYEFPGTSGKINQIYIEPNKVVSVRFTAPSEPMSGRYNRDTHPCVTNALYIRSISRCPGDFGPTACVFEDTNLTWTTDPELQGPVCRLVPGETYYLNYLSALLDEPGTTSCSQPSDGFGCSGAGVCQVFEGVTLF